MNLNSDVKAYLARFLLYKDLLNFMLTCKENYHDCFDVYREYKHQLYTTIYYLFIPLQPYYKHDLYIDNCKYELIIYTSLPVEIMNKFDIGGDNLISYIRNYIINLNRLFYYNHKYKVILRKNIEPTFFDTLGSTMVTIYNGTTHHQYLHTDDLFLEKEFSFKNFEDLFNFILKLFSRMPKKGLPFNQEMELVPSLFIDNDQCF